LDARWTGAWPPEKGTEAAIGEDEKKKPDKQAQPFCRWRVKHGPPGEAKIQMGGDFLGWGTKIFCAASVRREG